MDFPLCGALDETVSHFFIESAVLEDVLVLEDAGGKIAVQRENRR